MLNIVISNRFLHWIPIFLPVNHVPSYTYIFCDQYWHKIEVSQYMFMVGFVLQRDEPVSLELACTSFINDPQIVPMGLRRSTHNIHPIYGNIWHGESLWMVCLLFYGILLCDIQFENDWKGRKLEILRSIYKIRGLNCGPSYLKFIPYCMYGCYQKEQGSLWCFCHLNYVHNIHYQN